MERLITHGYNVLLPTGVNQRYDLVIDQDGEFVRCQCKTGRLENGVVLFSTKSVQCNSRRTIMRDYRGEVEVFLVYCPAIERVFCVPVEEAPSGYMSLRIEPTRNGQSHRVRWASDYELPA